MHMKRLVLPVHINVKSRLFLHSKSLEYGLNWFDDSSSIELLADGLN